MTILPIYMSEITFIIGGARSGKSSFALKLAKQGSQRVGFIATCEPLDKEMCRRIHKHRQLRPSGWKTFEEARQVSRLIKKIGNQFDLVIVDCLTLLVSNLLLKGFSHRVIAAEIKKICFGFKKSKLKGIIVSNEVGLGIVPDNKLSRDFRDIAGKANQIVAGYATEVFLMTAGLPLKIK